MTAEDYEEAGIEPPGEDTLYDRIQGLRLTGVWFEEWPEEFPRCEECGDETGECGCE